MSSGELPHNPFAAQYIRPGALPFLFPEGESAVAFVQRLEVSNWRGEILGPHGTGKSTLLASLRQPLIDAGRLLVWYELKQGDHALEAPVAAKSTASPAEKWQPETLVVVDGAEQLSWTQRQWLIAQCNWTKAGLLWTTHQPLGLPLLWETKPDIALAEQVVCQLMPPGDSRISDEDVREAFTAAKENLRETLFRLFDKYQRRV
jgi:hypothetical protein